MNKPFLLTLTKIIMKQLKNRIYFLSILLFAMLFVSCSSSVLQDTPPPVLKPLTFDYNPPTEGVTKSGEITFALLNPRYVETFTESNVDPYKTFANNMGADFVEMLTARSYQYKGPFPNVDDMVYSDKKMTDLCIQPIIELQFTGDYIKAKTMYRYGNVGGQEYYADGTMSVTGKLNLIFSEPFTKTKIWVKSIQIDPITFTLKSYYSYTARNIPVTDPMVWNSMVDNLIVVYQKILSTAWNHLEPEELLVKKAEANEIKEKSGYIKN
ncbi:MAG: hypothetical protein NTV87_14355 [Ignavibacteriae bacterium]|nr:hypothetical protein [Ignavibacteriota bacterium]